MKILRKCTAIMLIAVLMLPIVTLCVSAKSTNTSPVCLSSLEVVNWDRYTGNEGDSRLNVLGEKYEFGYGNKGIDGTVYENGLEAWIARWNFTDEISWVKYTYNLSSAYSLLTGKTSLIKSYNTSDFDTTIYFYNGETLLGSYRVTNDDYNKDININVKNVQELTILVKDNKAVRGGTSLALYDLYLDRSSVNYSEIKEFNGHYYKRYNYGLSWISAKEYCERLGGYLATVTSSDEELFIESLIDTGEKKSYWLGGFLSDDGWKWVTDEPFDSYTNWNEGEPNNYLNRGENSLLIENGKWNDQLPMGDPTGNSIEDTGFICEWDSYADLPQNAQNLTLEQYMSNVILDYNYNGCLHNLNGGTPQNFAYQYMLEPAQVSFSRTYVDLLHQDTDFMFSVNAWKTLTFSPSDITQNTLNEIGYYEAVIMNVLDCAVKYTILPSAVKDIQKTASGMTSAILKPIKLNAEIDFDKLQNQPWEQFNENEQLAMIEAAGAKCTSLKRISNYTSSISDIFSTAGDIRAVAEKLASLEKIAEVDNYIVNTLAALHANCPSDNIAMKTAIAEIKKVCESSFDKTMVQLLNGAATVTNIVASEGIDALWTDAVMAAGNGLGAGFLLGQVIGKTITNFMFSTDACKEQFYAMEALVNFEDAMVVTVKQFAENYKAFGTSECAKDFLTAEKILLSLYGVSADYAKDWTEIIKTKGFINGIQSVFGFGNKQDFKEFQKTAEIMKGHIDVYKSALFDFDFGYKEALKIDNPKLYASYLSAYSNTKEYWNASVMTVACPTNVDIYDENGERIACVIDNQLFGLVPGVAIWIDGDVKHLVLPKDRAYTVNIVGTDNGTMDYTVSEFTDGTYMREIAHTDVPLTTNCTYDTSIPNQDGIETDTYILTDGDGNTLSPTFDSKELKIAGASLTLQNDLTLNYKVDKSIFAENAYQNPYILFELNGVQTKVCDYIENENYYVFSFKNIAPNQMCDTVQATLCASVGDTVIRGKTVSYSVSTYCYNMLNRCTTPEYAKLRTLLVDLMQYGAQSQLYTNYQTDALVTERLTSEQLAYGTAIMPELKSVLNTAYETVENSTAQWKGAGLKLENAITARFILSVEDVTDVYVKFKTDFGEWTVPASDFEKTENGYYVYFNALHAGQLRVPIYATAYRGSTPISDTVCYSVESYAYAKQESTIPYLSDLIIAMMRYGDSAYAYIH